ncbi:MAG: DUF1989 domain-containing protein [Mycobacterium sp.]
MTAATETASPAGARAHARAQAGAAALVTPPTPEGVSDSKVVWAERIPISSYATKVLGRGAALRITDVDGDACVHLLLWRVGAPWERLNVADTVKVPWQAYLSVGHPLLSDQGRVLATMVADTSGHHDTFCGPTPAGRALLTRAAAKHGLGPRDIPGTVSFFQGVRVTSDGALHTTGSAGAGTYVEFITHLPVIAIAANCSHPLAGSTSSAADLIAWGAPERLHSLPNADPEYHRAVQNTERAWAAEQNWSEQL